LVGLLSLAGFALNDLRLPVLGLRGFVGLLSLLSLIGLRLGCRLERATGIEPA
jgi:hypothetical protein